MTEATSVWSDLANGSRWRGIVSFIRNWLGPFDSDLGMAPEELHVMLCAKGLNLPAAVREWYILAAGWNRRGTNVWIRPDKLAVQDAMIEILTDTEGINSWCISVADLGIEDPPVISLLDENSGSRAFQSFSEFVAAMIINDAIFTDAATDGLVELNHGAARAALTCIVSSHRGDIFVDAPLESATAVMFAYPGNGPAYGKSRTPAGRKLLQQLRSESST